MNNSPMGMIRDFIRSLTEQRTYPYYYRLRADQRAKRRQVTYAVISAFAMLIGFALFYATTDDATVQDQAAAEHVADALDIVTETPDPAAATAPQPAKEGWRRAKLIDCRTCPPVTIMESEGHGEIDRLGITTRPISFAEFHTFTADTGRALPPCPMKSPAEGVHCLSWDDAQAYADWLSLESSKIYRLPTVAEWQQANDILNMEGTIDSPYIARHWLGDCADSGPRDDETEPCMLRSIASGGAVAALPGDTRLDDAGFYLVRKLSRMSIY